MRPLLFRPCMAIAGAAAMAIASIVPIGAQRDSSPGCRVSGRAESGAVPLPGVSVAIRSGDTTSTTSTSTDVDGSYAISLSPGTYTLVATLTGFSAVERTITLPDGGSCDVGVRLPLTIAPRTQGARMQPTRRRLRWRDHPAVERWRTSGRWARGRRERSASVVIPER